MTNLITIEDKNYPIIELPGRPAAMLDRHVAEIYGVETKRVNEAVSRNPEKFPDDFIFELTSDEKSKVAKCDLTVPQYFTHAPKLFTWEGCNMLATILKSDIATKRAIQIVRGFTAMEKKMSSHSSTEILPTDSPMVQVAKQTLLLIQEQEKIRYEQDRQAKQIREIQAKQDAIIEQHGFFSVLGYANLIGRRVDIFLSQELGKMASKISRELDMQVGQVPDPRFGQVQTYHKSVLEMAFRKFGMY